MNDEVSACMNEKNSPSHINPRENRNSSANIFKTPLHIALQGTVNLNTPINLENKSKDIVQTTASSFTFSDSDTDWALETTINAPMPSKIEDSLQGNTSDSSVNRDQFTVLDVYKNDDA